MRLTSERANRDAVRFPEVRSSCGRRQLDLSHRVQFNVPAGLKADVPLDVEVKSAVLRVGVVYHHMT